MAPRRPLNKKPLVRVQVVSRSGGGLRKVAPLLPLAIGMTNAAVSSRRTNIAVLPPAAVSVQHQAGLVASGTPRPLLAKGHPVDWWFVFKLNAAKFPKCGGTDATRDCVFDDGTVSAPTYKTGTGQRYVVASSEAPALVDGGPQCLGDSTNDPVGASFDEVYRGGFNYLIWNDQFHDVNPAVLGCAKGECAAPWGHSKGILAWNNAGEGFVMQVSTPSWPNAGNPKFHQAVGNTLGCIQGDNNVGVSQHFFALSLSKGDVVKVVKALQLASVATDPTDPQVAHVGGPADVVGLVKTLGVRANVSTLDPAMPMTLSGGAKLIAKPSALNVPPWQMVSSVLGGVPLRTATWWASPFIPTTTTAGKPGCWDNSIPGTPGAVDIATSGTWNGTVFSLKGSPGTNGNHAKIGVSTSGTVPYAIFGDENQQGTLDGPDATCDSSQNGRGGLFFVMDNAALQKSMTALIKGTSASPEVPE